MACLPERIAELRFTTYNGEELVFRRCGYYFDLFADQKGRVIRLSEPARRIINDGTLAISYETHSLAVKHLVADAWIPSWEDHSPHLECVDGNESNVDVSNLKPSNSRKRGRSRDNYPLRCFKAMDLALHTRNLTLAAEESMIGVDDLIAAFLKYMPYVLHKDSPFRFVGAPKSLESVGMSPKMKKMIRESNLFIKRDDL